MLRMFTVFNLCPKFPSQEFLVCRMLRAHKGTIINDTEVGLLKFYKKQDFKFREKDREMRETHQSSLLGSAREKSRSLLQ